MLLIIWTALSLCGLCEPLEVLLPAQKVFRFAFSPQMFDWRGSLPEDSRGTRISSDRRIHYAPSLQGKPDLPQWIHYTYSQVQNVGFIYGVPPEELGSLYHMEVIATDISTYSLGIMRLSLNITKSSPGWSGHRNAVHLKIDNLDTEDIFSSHRLQNLKSIFKSLLWKESSEDLHLVDVSSALHRGYRAPLDPSHKNGILLKLGSSSNFSQELIRLDRETGPLRRKFPLCPQRDFHRTSVERHFRFEGFSLDWCAFRLMTLDHPSDQYRTVGVMEELDHPSSKKDHHHRHSDKKSPRKPQRPRIVVPSKSYIAETDTPSVYLTILFGTVLIFIGMITLITLIICFDVASPVSDEDVRLENTEGFIESFYLVLTDCFKCYREDGSHHQKQVGGSLQEQIGGEEIIHPRSRRASSIQRQTDSLRRSAQRKQMSHTPMSTLERRHFQDEEIQPPSCGGGEMELLFDERPYPPPYFYESNQMSESKSYLV